MEDNIMYLFLNFTILMLYNSTDSQIIILGMIMNRLVRIDK